MVTANKTGSSRKRKTSWIFSGLFGILGLLILFSSATAGVLMLILAFVISPKGTRTMEKLTPSFWKGRKKWISYIGSFIVILIIFMTSGHSISGIPGDYLGTVYPDRGTHNQQQVKDFASTFAQLILAYNSADTMERMSLKLSPLDFTEDGYVEMLGIISAKWKEVIERNNKLAKFKQYAGDEISYINIPKDPSILGVYAIGAEDAVDRALTSDDSKYKAYLAEQKGEAEKEIKKKIMEQIDLIKAAYPDKKRFEIIDARLGLAGKNGIARMEERSTDDVKEAADVVAYNNKREATYNAGQTAIKIILYTATAPEAIAAGGATTAVSIFLGGVDIGVGVGDTIDIVVNGDNENTLWKTIKSASKTGTDAYGNIMLIKDVTSLIKNPSKWTTDELMTVLNLAAGEVDPKEALILNVSEDGEMTIHHTDELPRELGFQGQTLKDFDTPPNLLDYNGDVPRFQVAYEQRKATKQRLERADIKAEIVRLKTIREEKLATDAAERARKKAEYQKINAATAQARKRTEINKRAQSEPAIKETLEKLNIDTTLPPAPVVPTKPSVAPGTITTCSVCMSAGLECACGRNACRCCNPGDDSCNGFDL